jgi:hypothetical protein
MWIIDYFGLNIVDGGVFIEFKERKLINFKSIIDTVKRKTISYDVDIGNIYIKK